MQADQTTVISLRPGGGSNGGPRGTRFSTSRFESASASLSDASQSFPSFKVPKETQSIFRFSCS
jgi:translation initiation factor 4G